MLNIHKTRFIAANYSNLQGLKAVPIGVLLVLVVLWANWQRGPASDLALPILAALAALALSWLINRYYQTRFGRVENTASQKRFELVLGIVGGAVGLGAFILDTSLHLPVSLIGLVFAAAVVVEHLRMQWYAPGTYLLPLTLGWFAVLLLTSILPQLGAGEWWLRLGLRAQLFGVLVVVGTVMVMNGLLGHWFFVRQLPGAED
jgi:hypothetical protein